VIIPLSQYCAIIATKIEEVVGGDRSVAPIASREQRKKWREREREQRRRLAYPGSRRAAAPHGSRGGAALDAARPPRLRHRRDPDHLKERARDQAASQGDDHQAKVQKSKKKKKKMLSSSP